MQNEPTTKTSTMKEGVSLGPATNRRQVMEASMDGSRFQDVLGLRLCLCLNIPYHSYRAGMVFHN